MKYSDLQNISNNAHFLLQAREESLKSEHHLARVGAILVRQGKIISRGFNKIRHNKEENSRWTNSLHAEIDCLKKIPIEKRKGCSLYIYREDRKANLANSMPCFYCLKTIIGSRLKFIVFTTSNGVSVIENFDEIKDLAKRY
jgi:deoxycytidylate deaminase